jgi:hypothetical protein
MFCEKYEKSVEKMRFEHVLRKKCEKCEKCEKMSKKTHLNIQLGRWNLDFFGSSFAAVTLLPAQLRQVENRRGAIQIDRKCTVQIADLFTISIAKQ